jgi:hypothetical protein
LEILPLASSTRLDIDNDSIEKCDVKTKLSSTSSVESPTRSVAKKIDFTSPKSTTNLLRERYYFQYQFHLNSQASTKLAPYFRHSNVVSVMEIWTLLNNQKKKNRKTVSIYFSLIKTDFRSGELSEKRL